jgi:PAS domain S-box-containing protein
VRKGKRGGKPAPDAARRVTRPVAEVARAQQRLQLALEASGMALWDTDMRTGEVVLSERWAQMVGAPPGETRTTVDALRALVHPEDIDKVVQRSRDSAKSDATLYQAEHRVRQQGGGWRWIHSRGRVIERDAAGRGLRMTGTIADITDTKERERAIAESEARFRSLVTLSSDWFWEQDSDFRFTSIITAETTAMHALRDEFLGRAPWEVAGLEPDLGDWRAHRAHLAAHRPFRGFLQLRRDAGGKERYLATSGEPVVDAAGRFAGYRGVGSDVTPRIRQSRATALAHERLALALEASRVSIWETDLAAGTVVLSEGWAEMLGETPGRTHTTLKALVGLTHPEDLEEVTRLSMEAVKGLRAEYSEEHRVRARTGEWRWVLSRGKVTARDAGGRALRMIGTNVDITERKRTEQALAESVSEAKTARERIERMNVELEETVTQRTAELRDALKELEAFSYSVSHDLRTPLGAINGFANLLRMKEADRLTEEGRKLLGFVESNAERLAQLVDGLLALSRIGRQAIARRRVVMQELVQDLMTEQAAPPEAQVQLGALPECHGDALLLRQVWANLLGNAFKYSRGSKPARIEVGFEGDNRAYFVRDNGAGFDMQYADKLFGAFERLHSDSEFEGTGIGLAIAERIVRRHGGRIWANSAPGDGATFWFTVGE